MNAASRERILAWAVGVFGAETFNRLVSSAPGTRAKGRLRFWQEELLARLSGEDGALLATVDNFLDVFEGAELQTIPKKSLTRERILGEAEPPVAFRCGGATFGHLDIVVLNKGLDFAMEWGPNWLCPIQDRLAVKFPQLSQAELDEYDRVCREAMRFGNGHLESCWREAQAEQRKTLELFRRDVVGRYPWVSDANLSQLFSQSWYYALYK